MKLNSRFTCRALFVTLILVIALAAIVVPNSKWTLTDGVQGVASRWTITDGDGLATQVAPNSKWTITDGFQGLASLETDSKWTLTD